MTPSDDVPFAKGQALGNDYAILDAAELPGAPAETGAAETGAAAAGPAAGRPSPALVRAFCDRHHGVGSDGILLGDVARKPFGLRIFNPDGTEAEKSGNGLRIFAAWLHDRGLVGEEAFDVGLAHEAVRLRVEGVAAGGALSIAAAMGRPSFEPDDIGFRLDAATAVRPLSYALDLGDAGSAVVHPVSLGNPHAVVLVDALERDDFLRRAPRICTHAAFANGTNVQLARVVAPDTLEAWIWERGAGETLASGSSACAVAAVARELGRVEGRALTVRMVGGEVRVEADADGALHLRGPAQIVYRGRIRGPVWATWAAATS